MTSEALKKSIESHFEGTFPVIPEKSGGKEIKIRYIAAEYAYLVYSRLFGTQQSLNRLGQRGGFHEKEIDVFFPEWRNYIV